MKCIVVDPLQTSHPCHRFCNCNETFTSCSLLDLCGIHCACHPKPRPNVQMWTLLNSSIAKSAQSAWNLKRFKAFDFETCFFEICFASQRHGTFCAVQLPKAFRGWGVSRRGRLQFLTSHPARWLRTRPLSEHIFRLSGATKHWKNTMSRDISTFLRTLIFFLLTLSSPTLSLLWSSFSWLSLLWLFLFFECSHNCCCVCP